MRNSKGTSDIHKKQGTQTSTHGLIKYEKHQNRRRVGMLQGSKNTVPGSRTREVKKVSETNISEQPYKNKENERKHEQKP